jgi:hypothetical protein
LVFGDGEPAEIVLLFPRFCSGKIGGALEMVKLNLAFHSACTIFVVKINSKIQGL